MLLSIIAVCGIATAANAAGILYPRASETREVVSLDGFWNFAIGDPAEPFRGHTEKWYNVNLKALGDVDVRKMPVPSSFNDIEVDQVLRDHVGLVWYQRSFFVPKAWSDQRVWIRFASVSRGAEVWINGELAITHDLGHLPFQQDISDLVNFGAENNLTVAVNNTLGKETIPQGTVQELDNGRVKQTYAFDFFNYAGIDRPVVLYTTPSTYIDDITAVTGFADDLVFLNYKVVLEGGASVSATISLVDADGQEVVTNADLLGTLFVPDAKLWWPYLMDPNPGYLYSFVVQLEDSGGNLVDKYVLPVGLRVVDYDNKGVTINNKPIYLRGFGRHEDSDIKGRALDLPLIMRDYDLIHWVGANAFRTSNYPYSEEIMDLADEYGIMVIDEVAAANADRFNKPMLNNHLQAVTELIERDKNRASVIMWSLSNNPATQKNSSENYFEQVVAHVKSVDTTRPVTIANNQLPDVDLSGQFIDVASINVYAAWATNTGDVDLIVDEVVNLARQWNQLYDVPVLVTEYGADALEGFHFLPAYVWSEEYQEKFLSKYFEAFDILRQDGFFLGEMIWNFADIKTDQNYQKVGGDRKGIFSRNRQPKAAAHLLRNRYWALAEELDQATAPDDLEPYIVGKSKVEL